MQQIVSSLVLGEGACFSTPSKDLQKNETFRLSPEIEQFQHVPNNILVFEVYLVIY